MKGDKACGPVCVFDSGIGGLNLLAACAHLCPEYDFVYFADNYNVPYGSLPPHKVCGLVDGIFEKMAALAPSAAVVACNTATALCVENLRKRYAFPIVGIQPAVKQAAALGGSFLVLATPATANSASLASLCIKYGGGRGEVVACPRLAAFVEDNIFSMPSGWEEELLPRRSPSCVVLGCTHYAFVSESIKKYYSRPVFDGILGTADHLRTLIGNVGGNCYHNQKIAFAGGDEQKNRAVFDKIFNSKCK